MSPVLVAVASVLGDQMKSKKALYPSCIFWTVVRNIRASGWVAEDYGL